MHHSRHFFILTVFLCGLTWPGNFFPRATDLFTCVTAQAGEPAGTPAIPGLTGPAENAEDVISQVPGYSYAKLTGLMDSITHNNVGRNNIPPLLHPVYVSVSDACLSMDDKEPVFVVHYPGGIIRVYPQNILVWHGALNDSLPKGKGQSFTQAEATGERYAITYCPITGTVVAFKGKAGRFASVFGVDGTLINGNSVLYDSATQSLWSQILAAAIDGPMRGQRLERIPVYWARWGGVKRHYPNAQVLCRSTGYKRDYGRDPYGSYFTAGTYYDDGRILFPVSRVDNRLAPKEPILGLEIENLYGALVKKDVRKAMVLNFTLGTTPLVAMYDMDMDRVTVFSRKLDDGMPLEFELFENRVVDTESRSEWNTDGKSTYGRMREKSLKPVLAIDCMWFAWYAFHQDTKIIDISSGNQGDRLPGPNIP